MTGLQQLPGQDGGNVGTSVRGVLRLFGRLFSIAVVGAAGVAGWFGVDQLALAEDEPTVSLPDLGGGLPTARLNEPPAWRVFQLTYSHDTYDEQYWFDLDGWKIRSEVANESGRDEIEIQGDEGYRRSADDAEWVAQDADATRAIASYVMGGIGPFLLTDLVPPDALGFTSLELEGTSKGERVYEVVIDSATLREQHPLLHRRWVETTRIIGDGSEMFRIRVREDGYVVRIDGEDATVTWSELDSGVNFESPLAGPATTLTTGAPLGGLPSNTPTDPAAVDPATGLPVPPPVDPATGLPVAPAVDPATGLPVAQAVDPSVVIGIGVVGDADGVPSED